MKTQNNSKSAKTIGSVKNAGKQTARFLKDNYKVVVLTAGLIAGGYFNNSVNAGTFTVYNVGKSVDVTGRTTAIQHISGATEGKESFDSYYLNDPNPLQIYSVNNNCDPNKLSIDARDSNSTTTYNLEFANNGFPGFTNNYMEFIPSSNSSNFEWKNIFFNIKGDKYDIKHHIDNGVFDPRFNKVVGKIELGILSGTQTGVYNTGTIDFFNHADLNRDRKVNLSDFAILGNEWRDSNEIDPDPNRFGSYVGKDVNDLGAYADIDRNGIVDFNDLGIYCSAYLWDANDSNTW